ncbi:kinase-like protein [Myriangium duriaei CBS 260.36]|uniref:non-specific serine/threonine protein kinase n=1 Tax=Myriangium duriaei CBS 260.36 TaxID=1168546 RepID=A0A9P4IZL4_9PEZI|nr:kinase-like protein [Myriangium duriaei CBS 260.36]
MHALDVYVPESVLLLEEEDALRYCPGGYHPVALGDTFKDGRYSVSRKLGHGGYSTVWLAWDRQLLCNVSLKIMTADHPNPHRELDNLLECRTKPSHGSQVIKLLDDFLHVGPNGLHQCLVLELLGPTLATEVHHSSESGGRLDSDEVCHIASQILRALAWLHGNDLAHGGTLVRRHAIKSGRTKQTTDLNARNIAFYSARLRTLPATELDEALGPIEQCDLVRLDGAKLSEHVPKTLVATPHWTGWPLEADLDDDDLPDLSEIRLLDLGEGFRISDAPTKLAQPSHLQAPETLFGGTIGYQIDLWRAGLMIYYLLTATWPIFWYDKTHFAAAIINFAGPPPYEWRDNPEWIALKDKLGNGHVGRSPLIHQKLLVAFDNEEIGRKLLDVMEKLTHMRPSDRISAIEAERLVERISSNT